MSFLSKEISIGICDCILLYDIAKNNLIVQFINNNKEILRTQIRGATQQFFDLFSKRDATEILKNDIEYV